MQWYIYGYWNQVLHESILLCGGNHCWGSIAFMSGALIQYVPWQLLVKYFSVTFLHNRCRNDIVVVKQPNNPEALICKRITALVSTAFYYSFSLWGSRVVMPYIELALSPSSHSPSKRSKNWTKDWSSDIHVCVCEGEGEPWPVWSCMCFALWR